MAQNPADREPIQPKPSRTPPRRVDDVDDEPFDVPSDRDEKGSRYGRKPEKGGGMGGGSKLFIIMAVIAAVVVYLMNFMGFSGGVKSTELNATLASISADIKASKAADDALKASVTTLTNQVSGMTSANAGTAQAVVSQNTKIDTAVNQVSGFNSQIGNLNTQLVTANANIAKLQTDLAAVKATPAVNAADLQKQLDANKASATDLQKQIDASKKQIDDLTKKIASIPATSTITSGTAYTGSGTSTGTNVGSSHTFQGVTATLTNLYGGFGGVPLLTFSVPNPGGGTINAITLSSPGAGYGANRENASVQIAQVNSNNNATAFINTNATGGITSCSLATGGSGYINTTGTLAGGSATVLISGASTVTAGTSQQLTLTLQIINTNAVPVNNVQMALGLAVVDSNGNPVNQPLPIGESISVSSGGFGTSWTFQSLASPNIWIFSNVASSNPFGLGAMSLQPGQTQSFTQYIQISNTVGGQSGTVYLYPIIRVLSLTP